MVPFYTRQTLLTAAYLPLISIIIYDGGICLRTTDDHQLNDLVIHYSKLLKVAVTSFHNTEAILATQIRLARITRK